MSQTKALCRLYVTDVTLTDFSLPYMQLFSLRLGVSLDQSESHLMINPREKKTKILLHSIVLVFSFSLFHLFNRSEGEAIVLIHMSILLQLGLGCLSWMWCWTTLQLLMPLLSSFERVNQDHTQRWGNKSERRRESQGHQMQKKEKDWLPQLIQLKLETEDEKQRGEAGERWASCAFVL